MLTINLGLAIINLSTWERAINNGALAQLGERHVCTVEVSGSIPLCSTIKYVNRWFQRFYFYIKKALASAFLSATITVSSVIATAVIISSKDEENNNYYNENCPNPTWAKSIIVSIVIWIWIHSVHKLSSFHYNIIKTFIMKYYKCPIMIIILCCYWLCIMIKNMIE